MPIRQTHTFVTLEVDARTYIVIERKLRDAGYDHVFQPDGTIDMSGIGINFDRTIPMVLECNSCLARPTIVRGQPSQAYDLCGACQEGHLYPVPER
jgi:hypothetical protein